MGISPMKITYASPNASHHYHLAKALDDQQSLFALISGWPRFASRSRHLDLNSKLIREDFFMTAALLLGRFRDSRDLWYRLVNLSLDNRSFEFAAQSDFFIYYRTCGINTNRRLKKVGSKAVCIVEEVNSHVLHAHQLVLDEYLKLGLLPSEFMHPYDVRKRLDSYQISDYILCPSTFVKRSFIQHGISASKIIVNPYGMAAVINEPLLDPRREDDVFRVLYVGQINIRKGLSYLVDAFKLIEHPRKELVIVGPMTSVTGLERTFIPDNVLFAGVLKGNKLQAEYHRASVFVLPSVEEGMALVLGEALSSGLPIVATTNTGAEDIISSGEHGFIVPPCDKQAIADALQVLIDDPGLLERMKDSCMRKASTVSTWSEAANSLIAILATHVGSTS